MSVAPCSAQVKLHLDLAAATSVDAVKSDAILATFAVTTVGMVRDIAGCYPMGVGELPAAACRQIVVTPLVQRAAAHRRRSDRAASECPTADPSDVPVGSDAAILLVADVDWAVCPPNASCWDAVAVPAHGPGWPVAAVDSMLDWQDFVVVPLSCGLLGSGDAFDSAAHVWVAGPPDAIAVAAAPLGWDGVASAIGGQVTMICGSGLNGSAARLVATAFAHRAADDWPN